MLETNSMLAESNLTREPELMEGREMIVKLSNEGEELTKVIEDKYKELSKYQRSITCTCPVACYHLYSAKS